jgi:hypothetical protein
MRPGLEVVTHPTGLWLVRAGREAFAVPAALGRGLLKWQGTRPSPAAWAATEPPPGADPEQWSRFLGQLAAALEADNRRGQPGRLPPPVWLRLPLVPTCCVRFLAGRLAGLASGRGLLLLTVMGSAGYGHLVLTATADPIRSTSGTVAVALGLFLLTALWHELGHAAALAHEGYPPGGVGAGLLFLIPVLFADVTAVGVLPRRGRLRVDLGGVVFQFGLGGVLAAAGVPFAGGQALVLASGLALVAVAWSLFPFIRADGYWLVCDLLGVEDLEAAGERPAGRWRRGFLSAYRLGNALFLLLVGVLLPLRYSRLAATLPGRLGLEPADARLRHLLWFLALVLLVVVWHQLLRRVIRLVKAAF